jgi:hypothetical protein|nr:MAG TPA: hypothetical protein [Caudoviricetes sp.]
MNIADVTTLPKATSVKDTDSLLLVRYNEDGSQTLFRVEGRDFIGRDAYEVAKEQGYAGTREEWEAQIARISGADISLDATTGELVIKS